MSRGVTYFMNGPKLAKKPSLLFGKFVTYCTACRIPCHLDCATQDEKANCDVMDHTIPEETRTCRVCPGKCSWNLHASEPFIGHTLRVHIKRFKWYDCEGKQSTTTGALKKTYETRLKKELNLPKIMEMLAAEIRTQKKDAVEQVITILRLLGRLYQIKLVFSK